MISVENENAAIANHSIQSRIPSQRHRGLSNRWFEMAKSHLDKRKAANDGTNAGKSKRALRKERRTAADLAEERRLTALLFGGGEVTATTVAGPQHDPEEDTFAFEIDRTGEESDGNNLEAESSKHSTIVPTEAQAAWVDDDDTKVEANLLQTSRLRKLRKERAEDGILTGSELETRLRERFQTTTQLNARVEWARLDRNAADASSSGDEDEFISSSAPMLLGPSQGSLPSNLIDMVRCRDVNESDPNKAAVQSVHFHPGSNADRPLALTAGFDKTLRFFQVGADGSDKVHGIYFPKLTIYTASFLGTSGKVIVSGRRSFFYVYDVVAGKLDLVERIPGRKEKSLEKFAASPDGRTVAFIGNDGYLILFDAQRKQWIADLKMNGSARALAFTPDGENLMSSGSDGDIYRWDLRTRRCIERFSNQDGTITASIASSNRHIAVGAESGVVNLYSGLSQKEYLVAKQRDPIKSIMNLHTAADCVRFNPDGQILAISSRREKHSMKLVHVPTASVFSNWPTSKTPLNYVWSMDFSPGSKFLAVGTDKGKCLLYRLPYYQDR